MYVHLSLAHSGLVESSGQSQWELLSVVDNKRRGSQQRMIEKLRYTAESWQQQSTGEGGMTTMERQQLEGERDRAREEKREMEGERDRAREEKREMEGERDRAREEKREMEEERNKAREEKRKMEGERATAREEKKKLEGERDRAREEKREIEGERDRAREEKRKLEGERDKAKEEKRNMEVERDGAMEEKREMEGERDRAREEKRKMEGERDRAREEKREMEGERDRAREEKSGMEGERDRAREEKRKMERERDRAREEKTEMEGERDRAREEKRQMEKERDRERQRVREMEGERERVSIELRRAQARANELQRRLEEVERREHEKCIVQQQAIAAEQRGPSWEVKEDELEVTEKTLGIGGWAVVKVAKLKVAAKCLHSQLIYDYHRRLFRREMDVAARVSHPNLLRFLGARLEGGMAILTEFMPTSLRDLVNRRPRQSLSLEHLLSIATDVARALNYLHNMTPDPIIHRDLSSANVLLQPTPDGGWLAKVSDYGTANFQSRLQTENPGSPVYTAPECYDPALQSPKMDIYSFGVLLVEMYTCDFPAPERREELMKSIDHPKLLNLIRQCLNRDKDRRPTAAQVVDILQTLQ